MKQDDARAVARDATEPGQPGQVQLLDVPRADLYPVRELFARQDGFEGICERVPRFAMLAFYGLGLH